MNRPFDPNIIEMPVRKRLIFYRMCILEELQKKHMLSCKDLKECIPRACEWMIREDSEWLYSNLIHEFDKPRWQEWGEAALIELKAVYIEIQASRDHRKRVNISWLVTINEQICKNAQNYPNFWGFLEIYMLNSDDYDSDGKFLLKIICRKW